MDDRKKCAGKCYDATGWGRRYPCQKWASIGIYCKTHDPATIKAKSEARHLKWKASFDARNTADEIARENRMVGAWVRDNGGWSTALPRTFEHYLMMAKEADGQRSK